MGKIEELLYIDPQRQIPGRECEICGGLVYPPGFHCPRCERDAYDAG